jgi:hypothetical protein
MKSTPAIAYCPSTTTRCDDEVRDDHDNIQYVSMPGSEGNDFMDRTGQEAAFQLSLIQIQQQSTKSGQVKYQNMVLTVCDADICQDPPTRQALCSENPAKKRETKAGANSKLKNDNRRLSKAESQGKYHFFASPCLFFC